MTRSCSPCSASAAATLTAVVVFPDAALLVGDREHPLLCRTRQLAIGRVQKSHCAFGLGADRGVGCSASDSMFHVKHLAPAGVPGRRHPDPDSSASPDRSRLSGAGFPRCATTTVAGGLQIVHATFHHPHIDGAQRCHHTPMLVDLVLRTLALDRQHPAAVAQQRHAPPRQLVQRGNRPGDNRVHLPHSLPHVRFLGPSPDDRHVQPSSSTTSCRNSLRRSSGSISVTRRSGRANANGIPGSPAPLPMSAIRSPWSSSSADRGAIE